MSKTFQIVTERVQLRRLAPTDLAAFQSYRHDEAVGRYQGWLPQSDADAAATLQQYSEATFFVPGKWFQIGIADRETGALIGDIGICISDTKTDTEIGFTLRRQSQGVGIAREAIAAMIQYMFTETDVQRVIGLTDTRNAASIKLLERLGMQRVTTISDEFRGEPCEEHLYALYKE